MGMRVLEYGDLEQRVVEGIKGNLTALDVVGEPAFGVGIRVIPPHSKVPKPGLPHARGRRILFTLRGSGTLSNGEYYEKLVAGKFAVLDDGEFPGFMTQDDELVVLEIRNDAAARAVPPTIAATLPMTVDAPSAVRPTTSYDQVD